MTLKQYSFLLLVPDRQKFKRPGIAPSGYLEQDFKLLHNWFIINRSRNLLRDTFNYIYYVLFDVCYVAPAFC